MRDHDDHRLSRGSASDPARNRERARAHALIYGHAVRGGVERESPEMHHFARELFLLARQCGASGLKEESRLLFSLAREASTPERSRGADFRCYRLAAAALGWGGRRARRCSSTACAAPPSDLALARRATVATNLHSMSARSLLLLSQVYPPDPAAVGQHLHDAAREMARRGWTVRVLTSARGYADPSARYPARERLDGVDVRRLGWGSFGKGACSRAPPAVSSS